MTKAFPARYLRTFTCSLALLFSLETINQAASPRWEKRKGGSPTSRLDCRLFAFLQSVQQDSQSITLNVPLERALAGGQTHTYPFTLNSNQLVRIKVLQQGIDVVLEWAGPDGKTLFEVDSPNGKNGIEPLAWVAKEAGQYQLRVKAPEATDPAAKYTITLTESRAATPEDESRVIADRGMVKAELLLGTFKADDLISARALYEDAQKRYLALGDKAAAAAALRKGAEASFAAGDIKRSLAEVDQALALFRELKDRPAEADALSVLAALYGSSSEWQKALDTVQTALPILRELKMEASEAQSLSTLGAIYATLGDVQRGLESYQQALAIVRRLEKPDRAQEASLLSNMAATHQTLGNSGRAIELLRESLAVARQYQAKVEEGNALRLLGEFQYELGDYPQALDYCRQALEVARSIGDQRLEAIALNDTGLAYYGLGDRQKAIEYYEKAIPLARQTNNPNAAAIALRNIGVSNMALGEREKALDAFLKALPILRIVKDRISELATLAMLGRLYLEKNELPKALELTKESLEISRAIKHVSSEGYVLSYLAEIHRAMGDLPAALSFGEESLKVTESLRASAGRNHRSVFLASVYDRYEFYIDSLMSDAKDPVDARRAAQAFEIAERARARSLLELLGESDARIREGVDPALLERERRLQKQLNERATRETRALSGKSTTEQAAAASREVDAAVAELDQVEKDIQRTSPRYASLTQPQPVKTAELQELLDDQSVLLEFSLGKKRSWVWAVTKSSVTAEPLASRDEIEAVAGKARDLLIARQPRAGMSAADHKALIAVSDAGLKTETLALSRLLFGPLAARLENEWKGKRLVIVPSGALEYIPFGVLPAPKGAADQLLIADHEIVNLPSGSVLALLRRENRTRPKPDKTLAVIADPVFEANDPRVTIASKAKPSSKAIIANVRSETPAPAAEPETDLKASVRGVGRDGLARLLFSGEEADAIVAYAPKNATLKATGFEANRTLVTGPGLERYRLVHFATHGLLNNQRPELSGLALSLVNENGQPEDGFLRMHEIFNLRLSADVVVLSACQTALGKQIRGEGLIGLTRGFMYAGARTVVASLWQVDDLATSELMKRFYRGMLKEDLRPAAALRAAQLEMAKSHRYAAPYYWAGFVLQGEWK